MPLFKCEAVHPNGDRINELRDAQSADSILLDLQNNGYVPIKIVKTSGGFSFLNRPMLGRLKDQDLLFFTQELSTLLQAGMPLDRAFRMLLDLTQESPLLHQVVDKALVKVKQGVALSIALEEQACGFSKFYIGILRAGEATGNVATSLQQLAEYIERMQALRRSVSSALVYPTILLVTSVASIILLMTLVLPQFATLFADAGKELPLPTQIVMGVSGALQQYWWLLIVLFIAFALLIQTVLQTPDLRYQWDRKCLTLPMVGELIKKIEVTRFSHTLSSLLLNGVPLLDALAIVKRTLTNTVMIGVMDDVSQHLKQGRLMSPVLEKSNAFPQLAVQMIKLGEETGDLKGVLSRLSITYDKEIKVTIQRLLSLFEPVLILLLGVIIAGIIFSVLMAIVSINDFAF